MNWNNITRLSNRFLHKIKKWNWSLFVVVLLVGCVGALENKSIANFSDGIILVMVFGIPIGLLWAWGTRDY